MGEEVTDRLAARRKKFVQRGVRYGFHVTGRCFGGVEHALSQVNLSGYAAAAFAERVRRSLRKLTQGTAHIAVSDLVRQARCPSKKSAGGGQLHPSRATRDDAGRAETTQGTAARGRSRQRTLLGLYEHRQQQNVVARQQSRRLPGLRPQRQAQAAQVAAPTLTKLGVQMMMAGAEQTSHGAYLPRCRI
jgi:hypothetical protein